MSDILYLVETLNDIEGLRELLRRGEDPNAQDELGRAALHIAAMEIENNLQDEDELLLVVRELINFGANVNLQDLIGYTPLHLATICRNYRILDILLQANAEINKKNYEQYSALHYASIENRFYSWIAPSRILYNDIDLQILKLLLKHNPDIDSQNIKGETPLMLAVQSNRLRIVEKLLEKNASVNSKNLDGETAMFYTLRVPRTNVNIMLELMRRGCSLTEPKNDGESPKDFYCRRIHTILSSVLVNDIKYVLKLLMLDDGKLNFYQTQRVTDLCRSGMVELIQCVEFCCSEHRKMRIDILSPNYSVYDIASRGAFCTAEVNKNNPIPLEVSNMMVEKLLKRLYPAYCDIIAAGLGSPYLNNKFVEMCISKKLFNQLGNSDIFYSISLYLSHFDILNFIYAYSTL